MRLLVFNTIATILLLVMNYEEAYASGTIRIGLESRYLNASTVSVSGPVYVEGVRLNGYIEIRVGTYSETHIQLFHNGNLFFANRHTPFIITPVDENGIYIRGRRYRGIIEIGRQRPGHGITPVNIVNFEDYLKSVVPSEMPASWHMQALMSQAVAARTFAMYRRGSHNHLGYELCDTVFSQVYNGIGFEHPRTTEAVLATRGRIITFNGAPILAVYSSSTGGFTESSEYVWLEAVPYLRAVPDLYETGGLIWDRAFTREQIQQATPVAANIGQITAIGINGRTPGGRVLALNIYGEYGTHTIMREQIRSFFAPIGGSLPGRMFQFDNPIGPPQGSITVPPANEQPPQTPPENLPPNEQLPPSHRQVFAVGQTGNVYEMPETFYAIGTAGVHPVNSGG
ncbi:MAG: SpoIID/LytB domain-containing protein, partial [Defluviitaleaceae bacterium]|nr:SpoIID/LytB domain-containing protein [Defluviitaleaceae bacterium]